MRKVAKPVSRVIVVATRFADINDETIALTKRNAVLHAELDKNTDALDALSAERAKLTLEMVSLTQGA